MLQVIMEITSVGMLLSTWLSGMCSFDLRIFWTDSDINYLQITSYSVYRQAMDFGTDLEMSY
jgi:hypothetical protein